MYGIISIGLEDFRSFKGKHSFIFPTKPGLYGVTGRNDAESQLGGNGAGKSSLLEAIRWCYYGSTSRGLRAGDIINYDAKSCSVTVECCIADETLTIARTQSPNSLRLNGTIVDQATLEKHLRIGPDAFAYAVMFPQFGDAFFDKSPADKLTLFSQVMELDYWLEKSKSADELAKELLAEKGKIEQEAARLDGSLATMKADIADLTSKRSTFDAEKQERVKQHKAKVKQAEDDLKFNRARHEAIGTTLKGLAQRQQRAAVDADACKALEAKQQIIIATLKRLGGLDAECPTCLQKVDARHLKAEKTRLEKAEQLILADLETVTGARQDLHTIEKNISDFESEKHTLGIKIGRADEVLSQAKQAMTAEQQRANPYEAMIEAKQAQRLKLKVSLEDVHSAIKQTEQDHVAVSYWVAGFKRIRLFIVEQALQQLELEINNSLSSLGLMEWRVELDVERENKSGGFTKGFTVLCYPPNATKPVRFESYSGGETQRLRLAGNLGLANLIMERAGLRSTIEFFDEPSSHLSEEGTLNLADTLMERAIDTEKRIFVIEHRLPDYPYTGLIKVVKDGNGSHIKE